MNFKPADISSLETLFLALLQLECPWVFLQRLCLLVCEFGRRKENF